MESLETVIDDINRTIADVETYQTNQTVSLSANMATLIIPDTRRAIGQLKAARTSLVKAFALLKSSEVTFVGPK
jgi:hypothetical protein